MLVRDGAGGLEVFLVRRPERAHAMPNVHVFPGGKVEPQDAQLAGRWPIAPSEWTSLSGRTDDITAPSAAATLYACSLRELFEEAGVLLVRNPGAIGRPPTANDVADQRRRLLADETTLQGVLDHLRLAPDMAALTPFSHWITPPSFPFRFDTWFFVAAMPADQEAAHCAVETTEGAWFRPVEVLAGALEGRFPLVFVTEQHLRRLTGFERVTQLAAFAAQKRIPVVEPGWETSPEGEILPFIPPDLGDAW